MTHTNSMTAASFKAASFKAALTKQDAEKLNKFVGSNVSRYPELPRTLVFQDTREVFEVTGRNLKNLANTNRHAFRALLTRYGSSQLTARMLEAAPTAVRSREEYALLRQQLGIESEDVVISVARKLGDSDPFSVFRRQRKEDITITHYEPTPNELVDIAISRNRLCAGCGKTLASFRAINGELPNTKPEKTVAMHIPAKAVADDRGQILGKEHVFPGHWTCNALMSDCTFETPEQLQENMPAMLASRKIDWVEPSRVKFIEDTITVRRAVIKDTAV